MTRRPTKRPPSADDIKLILARIDGGLNITLKQLAIARQCGLTRLYKSIHAGELLVVKQGRQTFIEPNVALAYLRGEAMPKGAKGDSLSAADSRRVDALRKYHSRERAS